MKKLTNILILILLSCSSLLADDWKKLLNLEGQWKFNIGDDTTWAGYYYNDLDWDEIHVPSAWEDEGYYDYNGYAWYRKRFDISENVNNKSIYLHLGYIDDVDQVYLNGKLINGSGSFPPNFETAYNANREYFIPSSLLNTKKENVIAVRVYDARLSGGIHYGDISLYYLDSFDMEINLEGEWKFRIGDNLDYKKIDFSDNEWDDIMVPSKWETSGYKNYNGFGWYRKNVFIGNRLKDEKLVIVLGRIDDIDECYINGKLVGSTGDFVVTPKFNDFDNEYQEFRGYIIPEGILNINGNNTIAVRVYDGYLDGGIYQGPIGITTQEIYREYWKEKKKEKRKKSLWEIIFDN